jgi:hypothetical protein
MTPVVVGAAVAWAAEQKLHLLAVGAALVASAWQNDPLAPFFPAETTAIWLATNNPNYNVHMLAASLIAAW